jgi:hypothetical protein
MANVLNRKKTVTIAFALCIACLFYMLSEAIGGERLSHVRSPLVRPASGLSTGKADGLHSRRYLDEIPIHVMFIMCVRFTMEASDAGLTSLRSILAARELGVSRNRRYVFHFILDKWSAWLMNHNTSAKVPHGSLLEPSFITTFHDM